MDGDVAPIADIAEIAERYGALTYIERKGLYAVGMSSTAARRGDLRARRRDRPD